MNAAPCIVLSSHLERGGEVTTALIRKKFGVSKATAKRYMHRLESALPVLASVREGRVVLRLAQLDLFRHHRSARRES